VLRSLSSIRERRFSHSTSKTKKIYSGNFWLMVRYKNVREDLRFLIDKLHEDSIGYIRGLAENPENIALKKADIDSTLHNIFYLIKIVRAKYEVIFWSNFKARSNLTEIYKSEIETRKDLGQKKLQKLKEIREKLRAARGTSKVAT
jgi:hypothetical protein